MAPNQSGPSQSFQPGRPLFRTDIGAGVIDGNPLNGFIDVMYHISMSAISESSIKKIQPGLVNQGASCGQYVDEMQAAVRKDGSVTLASTGEVFRNNAIEVSERETQTIEPTEAQRTKASQQIEVLEKRFKELKEQQKNIEKWKPGTVALTSPIITQQWNVRRAIQAVKDGLPVARDVEVLLPPELRSIDRRYYNIKSLSFTNVMSPSPQNPMFANFLGAEMTLIEPYGFKLHEDIKELANQLGYAGIHAHRMVWRIDIHFSGYNQDTGQYVPFIPVSPKATSQGGCDGSKVSYYMVITSMDAKTTHEGTEYKIKLAPSGAMAARPEDIFLEAHHIEHGGTFGEFLQNLSAYLKKQKDSQVRAPGSDREEDFTLERTYEFIAPEDLIGSPFSRKVGDSTEHDNSENPGDGGKYHFEKGSTILSLLRRVLGDIEKVQKDFLVAGEDNSEFTIPRVHYTIRFNTIYDEKNSNINDYRKMKFQYIIEPHLSYKDFTPISTKQILRTLSLQSRLKRLKEMIAYGMVQRKYDYLFTSENTEVINLDLSFSVFYYKTLAQDDTNSALYTLLATANEASGTGVDSDKTTQNFNQEDEEKSDSKVLNRITNIEFRKRVERSIDKTLRRLFGFAPSNTIDASAANINLMSMALTPSQKSILSKSANRSDGSKDGKFNLKNLYLREIDDNLNNDLLTIEMEVRGDPVYLYSPYASQNLNTLEPFNAIRFSNTTGTTGSNPDSNKLGVQPSVDKVIFLNILTPNQVDYMNPNREFASSNDSIVGGFYIIIKVETFLDDGKFTQKIHATKIANLNYLSENIGLFEKQRLSGAPNPDNSGVTEE